jgi:hypothetical protein
VREIAGNDARSRMSRAAAALYVPGSRQLSLGGGPSAAILDVHKPLD